MDTAEVNRYECIIAEVNWTDEDGAPIDLTGRTLSIIESSPRSLMDATVTITDAIAGQSELFISKELSRTMGVGRVNWIRISMSVGGSCIDTTPLIWISPA